MVEVNIIKIDGKPLEKLIDVISKGIGKLYEPKEIRKRADAEAYEIEVKEAAKSKAIGEAKTDAVEVELKIRNRLNFKESKRQHNIESISYVAAKQLKDEPDVSEEEVDEDWITRFFNIAEDVSNEEMQMLWGQILAGEVKRPKSYSLRTLEFLRNLSKQEAELIKKVGKLKLLAAGRNSIYNPNDGQFLAVNYDIEYSDILSLRELGVLSPSDSALAFADITKGDVQHIIYGDKCIQIARVEDGTAINLPLITFTKTGMEILQLIDTNYYLDYVQQIAMFYKGIDKNLQCQIGDLRMSQSGYKHIENLVDINTDITA